MDSLIKKIETFAQLKASTKAIHDHESGVVLTYSQLVENICLIKEQLTKFGIRRKPVVGIIASECPAAIISLLSLGALDWIAVPLENYQVETQWKNISADIELDYILTTASSFKILPDEIKEITPEKITNNLGVSDIFLIPVMFSEKSGSIKNNSSLENSSLIVFTSGTTNKPKGVLLSATNLYSAAESMALVVGAFENLRVLIPLSLTHMYGIIVALTHLSTGGTLFFVDHNCDGEKLIGVLRNYKIQGLPLQPRHVDMLLKTNPASFNKTDLKLEYISSASAGLPVAQILALADFIESSKIIIYYALTEAPRAVCVVNPHLLPAKQMSTIGKAAPGMKAKIKSFIGGEAANGEIGEIVLSGPVIALGYLTMSEKEKDPFRDGEFYTGDVGVSDTEGYLYWQGRVSDIIHWEGISINPFNIERQIERISGVNSAVLVLDLSVDSLFEPHLILVIECKNIPELDVFGIQECIRNFNFPLNFQYKIVNRIPRNINGKVLRNKVSEII